jgi:hypothetical protein
VTWWRGGSCIFLFPAGTKVSGADLPQHLRETGCCVFAANVMFHTKWNWLMKHCGDVDWINLAYEVVQLRAVLNSADVSEFIKRVEVFWTVDQLLALNKSSSTWTWLCRYLGILSSVISRNCWHADRLTDWPFPVCRTVREWIQENAKNMLKWASWKGGKKWHSIYQHAVIVFLISNALSASPNNMWLCYYAWWQ